jgi:YVTN family beta-propeller protein
MTVLVRKLRQLGAFATVCGLLGPIAAFAAEPYRSPLALVARDSFVYVAEHTSNRLAIVDVNTNTVTRTFALPAAPNGLALSADGTLLYVACGGADGRVCAIRTADGALVQEWPAGHTPTAPALSPDGLTLYVCSQFNDEVLVIDLAGAVPPQAVPVTREPVASVLSADGARLFVANLLPAGRADADYLSAAVDVIDTTSRTVAASIALPNGSGALLGICLSPDGQYAYVTHVLSRYQLPTTQLERGWMNTNAVSIIDVASAALVNTVLLDDVDLGAPNPWGILCTADGQWLCVAQSGNHELSVIDRNRLHERLAASVSAGEASKVPNDLSYVYEIRRRVKLSGNGPRGLAALGSRVFAAEYFSGSVAVVDLAASPPLATSIPLGPEPPLSAERTGERMFHDATLCFQQWQSCASCHPGGARVDALNWDLLNDGMGNPKNTKSLLLAYQTPPSMAMGVRATAHVASRAGIRYILFNVVPEEQAAHLDTYLQALLPVPSPRLIQGALSPAAERGKAVFEKAGCIVCHPAPLFSDLQAHNAGTGVGRDVETQFDTPTLVEVWRTAPYLHDGRARTILEMR